MPMRTLAVLLLFVVALAPLRAAVPPQQVTWTQPGVDPSQAQSFFYSLTIREEGSPILRVVSLLNTLCGGSATAAECSTALPVEAQTAIVTGNISYLTALDARTNQSSALSAPFVGDQGCIFRDNLYALGARASASTQGQGGNVLALSREFRLAKFKFVSITFEKGTTTLLEECVGYIDVVRASADPDIPPK